MKDAFLELIIILGDTIMLCHTVGKCISFTEFSMRDNDFENMDVNILET